MKECMKRSLSSLDVETKHTHADQENLHEGNELDPKVSAAENKRKFRENFGIEFKIPTLHVLDTKIFPKDPSYQVQLLKYVLPELE